MQKDCNISTYACVNIQKAYYKHHEHGLSPLHPPQILKDELLTSSECNVVRSKSTMLTVGGLTIQESCLYSFCNELL